MVVEVEDVKKRLDVYLSEKLDISRSKVQKQIERGNILVNNKEVSSNYKVKENDVIKVMEGDDDNLDIVKPENIPLDIVYEDDYLMIINKKSGMVVHPAAGHYEGTLVNALAYYLNLKDLTNLRPGIVHRLDKDTSGLMVVAKDEKTLELLSEMIKNKKIHRHYSALVQGVIMHSTGTIEAPIARDPNNRQKQAVVENGKPSVTHFKVLERFKDATLVECILDTGRTHQIRVHMKYIGHPVLNDPVYGNKKASDFGQMLHSKSIEFDHPITGKHLFFEVDVPKEFQAELDSLSNV